MGGEAKGQREGKRKKGETEGGREMERKASRLIYTTHEANKIQFPI